MSDDADGPVICPICGADFESVSLHEEGLMVKLRDDERFRRACFQPVSDDEGTPLIRFFHHTHEQSDSGESGTVGGRVP
ncbi:hypothetical protein NDI85_03620 [Halomicroarcula sp. S1AR25-4]|uniref:hypothetical protein n=1 Tax=Haloarcula sp. S1AR25-4 TaxID=2950538 RepID=UPI00287573F0|nr:hypothetical protein [Halomicroarcula sp. S1AR25-4]MDS0276869.1 hypothetical protein [Halomicroarcula sp. S1AR25-4]